MLGPQAFLEDPFEPEKDVLGAGLIVMILRLFPFKSTDPLNLQ